MNEGDKSQISIEVSQPLAAALKLHANRLLRRKNDSGEAGAGTFEEALQVVLRDNKPFARLYEDMGAVWPAEGGGK